jgi:predicted transposase YdaD
MSTTPYDDAFKELAERDPAALLLLLGVLQPDEPAQVTVLSRELRAAKQIADQIYLVKTTASERLIHIEAQTRWEAALPERVLDYALLIWISYERQYPVESYVLLLTPHRLPEHPPTSLSLTAGSLQVSIHYHLVRLWDLPADDVLALRRDQLLPFVPLMKGDLEELSRSAQYLHQVADEQERAALTLHWFVLAGLRYNTEALLTILRRKDMYGIPLGQLEESSGYQYLFQRAQEKGREKGREEGREEGREKGREEGREEGRAEGQQEGRQQAVINLFRRLAAKRFPGLQFGDELAQISDVAALEQLCLDLDQVSEASALEQRVAELVEQSRAK